MALFEPIEVTWKGEQKTVPADKVMRVLGNLEEHLTFFDANDLIVEAAQNNKRRQVKVSTAYASFLKSCGFRVTPEEVMQTLDLSAYIAALSEVVNVLKLALSPEERERYDAIVAESESEEIPQDAEPVKKKQADANRSRETPSKA